MMATGGILWTGLVLCVAALILRLAPELARSAGVDVDAAWFVFGFGLFLIATNVLLSMKQMETGDWPRNRRER